MVNEVDWLGRDNLIGIDIWRKKYRSGDETFEAWLNRISGGNQAVKELIWNKKFLFGGRVLANRGLKDQKVTLSNCYVIPVRDNLEEIFNGARDIAITYSRGGGCGINLSSLCPAGAPINNAAKESSGALSFGFIYDLTTSIIGQEGRRIQF